MRSGLIGIASFVFAIAVVLVVCRVKKLPLRETLALRLPTARQAALWLGVFALAVVTEELILKRLGLGETAKWTPSPTLLLRAAGIIIFAPVAEEMIFRGLLFNRIAAARSVGLAVVVTSIVFAAVHIQYSVAEQGFILVDALIFALPRAKSGSLPLTMLMHCAGNAYAVYQRLS